MRIDTDPQTVWRVVRAVGGRRGWYYAQPLWWLRGFIDRLAGGVGLRRGRRHPTRIGVGDAVDFWRVLEVEQERKLVLLAEMKLPGEATLTFQITPVADGSTQLTLLSRFLPRGLAGLVYWYALYPAHELIFMGMAKAIGPGHRRQNDRATPTLHTAAGRKLRYPCLERHRMQIGAVISIIKPARPQSPIPVAPSRIAPTSRPKRQPPE